MSTLSSDSTVFRDGYFDPQALLQHQRSGASNSSSATWHGQAPSNGSLNSTCSWPHDLRLPTGPPSISPFVSARGQPGTGGAFEQAAKNAKNGT